MPNCVNDTRWFELTCFDEGNGTATSSSTCQLGVQTQCIADAAHFVQSWMTYTQRIQDILIQVDELLETGFILNLFRFWV